MADIIKHFPHIPGSIINSGIFSVSVVILILVAIGLLPVLFNIVFLFFVTSF